MRFAFLILLEVGCPASGVTGHKEHLMLDLILISLGLGFFVLAVGYTIACDRL
jgi:hypothetical protein